MKTLIADVAELADAQVSEACDGDIVEVQVLSSAPKKIKASLLLTRLAFCSSTYWNQSHSEAYFKLSLPLGQKCFLQSRIKKGF